MVGRCKIWFKRVIKLGVTLGVTGAFILGVATHQSLREMPSNLDELTIADAKPQLLDRHGRALTVTYQNRWNAHQQLDLHSIPSFMQQAMILAEDKRFYQHAGMDWRARFNALLQNVLALKAVRGASTISEQVVRMIQPRPRSIWVRWLEGWEARALEQQIDKATILEFYLNQVPYAAQRRGVVQAARYYFDRDLATLNQKEMLALAVLVRAPSRFDLYKSTDRIQGRLERLIQRAENTGLLANKEEVLTTEFELQRPRLAANATHFSRYVFSLLEGRSSNKVMTTLDADVQAVARHLLNERLTHLANRDVANAGMIVVDLQSNEVLAWAVGSNANGEGEAFDTIVNKRQPGSTLKPFVYAAALQKGWTAATMLDDSPLYEGVGQGVHAYRNYSNQFYGAISLREALGNSLNIPAIKAAKYVGLTPLLKQFHSLGLTDLDLRSVDYGNGIALGNGEISLLALAQAYTVLARQGEYQTLNVLQQNSSDTKRRIYSPEVSSLIAHILSDADARAREFGRGGVLNLPIQTAVKTGTSTDYRDAWVFGFNHRYLVGVWMGNLDNQPMQNITGSTGPALVMRSMFAELNKRQPARGLYLSRKLVQRTVCAESGLSFNENCTRKDEYFIAQASNDGYSELAASIQAMQKKTPVFGDVEEVNLNPFKLASPIDQSHLAYDPRIPESLQHLQFKLDHSQDLHRVEWFVNDELFAISERADQAWPIRRGKHTVTAKVYTKTAPKNAQVLSAYYVVK